MKLNPFRTSFWVLLSLSIISCAAPKVYQAPIGSETAKFTLIDNSRFLGVTGVIYENAETCLGFAQLESNSAGPRHDKTIALEANREHSMGLHLPISTSFSGYKQVTFRTCNHYITFPVASGFEYRYVTDLVGETCYRTLQRRTPASIQWEPAPFRLRQIEENYVRFQVGNVCKPEGN